MHKKTFSMFIIIASIFLHASTPLMAREHKTSWATGARLGGSAVLLGMATISGWVGHEVVKGSNEVLKSQEDYLGLWLSIGLKLGSLPCFLFSGVTGIMGAYLGYEAYQDLSAQKK